MANAMRSSTSKNLFAAGTSSATTQHSSEQSLLSNLPSFDRKNFSKFQSSTQTIINSKGPSIYLPLRETSNSQIITTEKTNILLRYLHIQTGSKRASKRRDLSPSEEASRKKNRPTEDPSNDIDTNVERSDDD